MMMRVLAILLMAAATVLGQDYDQVVNFEDLASEGGEEEAAAPAADGEQDVGLRLGLLANTLGVDPLASGGGRPQQQQQQQQQQQAAGRLPPGGTAQQQQCCCVSASDQCGDLQGRDDVTGAGVIDQRVRGRLAAGGDPESGISIRIVNRPLPNNKEEINSCPPGLKSCCFDADVNLSVFGRTCITPEQAQAATQGLWRQTCPEQTVPGGGGKECGSRQWSPAPNRKQGEASPGEFPWTCLLLNQNNDFIGTCALIPQDFSNNNAKGTKKVITAAHKLAKIGSKDLLKVRLGEYDASGFNPPEAIQHQEYTVVRILKHPQFNTARLDHDLAILTLDKVVDLSSPTVNTVCLPGCDDQFNFRFNNGSGTRCWVAGWGKNSADGSFQFLQHKVDLPLVESTRCNAELKAAINKKKSGVGDKFALDTSELCAGGEVGKDACTGDGGSPLVCQAQSGRWTVVGLVTWGVGCASDIPGVYARVAYFRDWINAN